MKAPTPRNDCYYIEYKTPDVDQWFLYDHEFNYEDASSLEWAKEVYYELIRDSNLPGFRFRIAKYQVAMSKQIVHGDGSRDDDNPT